MIALVTDSSSQIPPTLVDRFGVSVVPLPVTVDGVEYLEGVDLDADDFYARFQSSAPQVSTAHPSPGRFAATYRSLAAHGADEIISVHIGSALSGTVNSARLAAADLSVPVRIVDTGTASFAIALCVWAAAEALAAGGSSDDAVAGATATAERIGNVFIVRALDLARAGGRLARGATAAGDEIPVLTITAGSMTVVGQASDLDAASDVMAEHVRRGGERLRVGIGAADRAVFPFWDAMEERLAGAPEVHEVVRYRVGPSVGAHTGPGTVGVMYAPALGR